jgi:hypothetical protein
MTALSATVLNTARKDAACVGSPNGYGYIFGGHNGTDPLATVEKYDPIAGTCSAVATAVLATAKQAAAAGNVGYWVYVAGGVGALINGQMDRINTSPAPAQARYIATHKGTVFLARSSTYPSRVWYSDPGDSFQWPDYNFFDVNPDDGDWITGIFEFDNQLYVCKRDKMYRIIATVFAPDPVGDISYVALAGACGSVNQKSICITDHGVYYVAEDTLRFFDGQVSHDIGKEIVDSFLLAVYASGNIRGSSVVWHKRNMEVWFCLSDDTNLGFPPYVWNYEQKKWGGYIFSNTTGSGALDYPSLLAIVEDTNDYDRLLSLPYSCYGIMEIAGNNMDPLAQWGTTAIPIGGYTTGVFFPAGIDRIASGASLELIFERPSSSTTVNVTITNIDLGALPANTQIVTDLDLKSGTYPDLYFGSATQVSCRIPLDEKMEGHGFKVRLRATQNGKPFILVGMIFHGHISQQEVTSP